MCGKIEWKWNMNYLIFLKKNHSHPRESCKISHSHKICTSEKHSTLSLDLVCETSHFCLINIPSFHSIVKISRGAFLRNFSFSRTVSRRRKLLLKMIKLQYLQFCFDNVLSFFFFNCYAEIWAKNWKEKIMHW